MNIAESLKNLSISIIEKIVGASDDFESALEDQIRMCEAQNEIMALSNHESDERTREVTPNPSAIFKSYNSHDCEAWYKCPVCNELFSSWSVYCQSKNENGTNKYCPKCKKELSGLD